MALFGKFNKKKKEKLDKGLEKTKSNVFQKLSRAVAGKSKVDDDFLDELEEILISSDVGVQTTIKIIDRLEKRVAQDKFVGAKELNNLLKEEIALLLSENHKSDADAKWEATDGNPYVIMVVGVNGVGKTTTIGKLAYQLKNDGKKVYLGAADTFRAAAVEQLEVWSKRVDVPIIKQKMGSDPASVAFDTLKSAKANNAVMATEIRKRRCRSARRASRQGNRFIRVIADRTPASPSHTQSSSKGHRYSRPEG
jgi:fused signal recognition particle receptor